MRSDLLRAGTPPNQSHLGYIVELLPLCDTQVGFPSTTMVHSTLPETKVLVSTPHCCEIHCSVTSGANKLPDVQTICVMFECTLFSRAKILSWGLVDTANQTKPYQPFVCQTRVYSTSPSYFTISRRFPSRSFGPTPNKTRGVMLRRRLELCGNPLARCP